MLVRSPFARGRLRRRRLRVRRHAGRADRPQSAHDVGHHEQHLLAARSCIRRQTSDEHPGCYLFDGEWKPGRELTELIHVRGFGPLAKRIVFSHNGPIVDEILPPPANRNGSRFLEMARRVPGGLADRAAR